MNNELNNIEKSILKESIQRLLDSGRPFALFRYPQSECTELILQDHDDVTILKKSDKNIYGFVFAPFHLTDDCPAILIRPDIHAIGWEQIAMVSCRLSQSTETTVDFHHRKCETSNVNESSSYDAYFEDATERIRKGELKKIVLSYCQEEQGRYHLYGKEAEIFLSALTAYPNSMVSLIRTSRSGCWIGSTPETLLQRKDDRWSTMALAGTRTQEEGDWDSKNLAEQDIVTQYVKDVLQQLGADVVMGENSTMHTGNLMHIRTDINFQFATKKDTLDVLKALHPTPAVCGMPQQNAFQAILSHEGESRYYFSGYLGVIKGNEEAHIFVNLRCAHICKEATHYHAGGGITAQSQLQNEKNEIQNKLNTLKKLVSSTIQPDRPC